MPQQLARAAGDVLVQRKEPEVADLLVSAEPELRLRRGSSAARPGYAGARHRQRSRCVGGSAGAGALTGGSKHAGFTLTARNIVAALVQLGGKDALAPLRQTLLTYRSDPMFRQAMPRRATGR